MNKKFNKATLKLVANQAAKKVKKKAEIKNKKPQLTKKIK